MLSIHNYPHFSATIVIIILMILLFPFLYYTISKLVGKIATVFVSSNFLELLSPTLLLSLCDTTSTATRPLRNIFRMMQWVEFKCALVFDCKLCIMAFRPG
mmetsp:Transcript_21486/g.22991  ORF Transcript_21486/g.22991 Transcript_21486/m.22991 type:complete len:101 (-) Transcript_21486:132-434(-)